MNTKIGINLSSIETNYCLLNTKMTKETRKTIQAAIGREELDKLLLAASKIPTLPEDTVTFSTHWTDNGSHIIDVAISSLEGRFEAPKRKSVGILDYIELQEWLKQQVKEFIYG